MILESIYLGNHHNHHGKKNPMFGKHHSEETRRKMSEAWKLRGPVSEETRRKLSEVHRGKSPSEEHRRKLSEVSLGKKNHNYGKHPSEKTRKKQSEAHSGEKCHFWNGGTSFEPYCIKFNREFKERVRKFFGYRCVECNTPQNGRKLDVHHVNFNKMSCCDKIEPLFVSLCLSCHSKTNHNREYWEQHLTKIINEQYSGQCYLHKDIEQIKAG